VLTSIPTTSTTVPEATTTTEPPGVLTSIPGDEPDTPDELAFTGLNAERLLLVALIGIALGVSLTTTARLTSARVSATEQHSDD